MKNKIITTIVLLLALFCRISAQENSLEKKITPNAAAGIGAYLTVSPTSKSVSSSSGSFTISVSSNTSWTVSDNATWVNRSLSSGTGNRLVTITYQTNSSTSSRSATITFRDGSSSSTQKAEGNDQIRGAVESITRTVSLTQAGAPNQTPTATINSVTPDPCYVGQTVTFSGSGTDPDGGSITAYEWANEDLGIVSTNASFSMTMPDIINYPFAFRVKDDENTWSSYTWYTPVVNDPPVLTANPTNPSVGSAAGSTSISVSSNTSWTVSESVSWITSISPSSGSGNGSFNINYSANTSFTSRNGTVTLSGGGINRTITVTQSGETPYLNVSTNSLSVGSDAGTTAFDIYANQSLDWEMIYSYDWILTSPDDLRSGDRTVTVTFEANTSTSPRSTDIVVNSDSPLGLSQTVTITQDGIPNQIPIASIISISPNPAFYGETVTFTGTGSDPDGGSIVEYEWFSDILGVLSTQASFSTSFTYEASGQIITFKVKDDEGSWSSPKYTGVNLISSAPTATISVNNTTVNEGETVLFNGSGTDPNGGSIVTYQWEQSDGTGYQVVSSATNYGTNFNVGSYGVRLKVKDDQNEWSGYDTKVMTVNNVLPTATIISITPNPVVEGQSVTLSGSGSDPYGSIMAYEWQSSINGYIGNTPNITLTNLSAGTHTIQFRVQDDENSWSPWDSQSFQVIQAQPPEAQILSISPNPVFYGETLTFTGTGSDPDGGSIVEYEWFSDILGVLSTQAVYTTTVTFETAGQIITFKVKDDEGQWSSPEYVTGLSIIDPAPTASITVNNTTVNEGETVLFNGSGTDPNGGSIIDYEWQRNDGSGFVTVGNGSSYTTQFNVGTYGIALKVKDDQNEWSGYFSIVMTVNDVLPTATITAPSDNTTEIIYGEESIYFSGYGSEGFGNITEYQWISDIDGIISTEASFNCNYLSLSGAHVIQFKVKDDEGNWSQPDYVGVSIIGSRDPYVEISVSPTTVNCGVPVYGVGKVYDKLKQEIDANEYEWILLGNPNTVIGNSKLLTEYFLLNKGINDIAFRAKVDGIWTPEKSVQVIVDNNKPENLSISVAHNPVGLGYSTPVTGTATDPEGLNTISEYRWYIDDTRYIGSGTSVVIPNDLAAGTHEIKLEVEDYCGDVSTKTSPLEVLNHSNPTVEIVQFPTDGTEWQESFSVEAIGKTYGGPEISKIIWLDLWGNQISEGFTTNIPLEPGDNIIYVIAENVNGVKSEPLRKDVRITKKPEVTNITVTPASAVYGTSFIFTGSWRDEDGGDIQGYEWGMRNPAGDNYEVVSTEPSFTLRELSPFYDYLSIGANSISLKVKDDENEWSQTASAAFTVQNALPNITAASYSPVTVSPGEDVTFTVMANDPDGGPFNKVEWFANDVSIGTGTPLVKNNLAIGTYSIHVEITDNEEEIMTHPLSGLLTIENPILYPPFAVIKSITPDQPVVGDSVTFSAEAIDHDGGPVTYEWRSSLVTGVLSNLETFTKNDLPQGTHIITLKVTDDENEFVEVRRTLEVKPALTLAGQNWKKINYEYDLLGNTLKETIDDEHSIRYVYDNQSRLTDVYSQVGDEVSETHEANYSYTADDKVEKLKLKSIKNLVENGGLETDDSWTAYSDTFSENFRTTEKRTEGNYSRKLSCSGSSGWYSSNQYFLDNTKKYLVSAKIYVETGTVNFIMDMQGRARKPDFYFQQEAGWQSLEFVYIPHKTSDYHYLTLVVYDNSTVFLDDVKITEIKSIVHNGNNLITDGSFEFGTHAYTEYNSPTKVEIVDTTSSSGYQSLRIENTAPSNGGILNNQLTLDANKFYKIAVKSYIPLNSYSSFLYLWTDTEFRIENNVKDAWSALELIVKGNGDPLDIYLKGAADNYSYFDDFSVYEVELVFQETLEDEINYEYNANRPWLDKITYKDKFLQDLGYFRNGNIESQQITNAGHGWQDLSLNYTYDGYNRLTGMTGSYNASYVYDNDGNFETKYEQNIGDISYTYHSGNNLLDKITIHEELLNIDYDFDQDAKGNVIIDQKSGLTGATYNHLNLPTSLTAWGSTLNYRYNDAGQRIEKKDVTTGEEDNYIYNAAGRQIAVYDKYGRLKMLNLHGNGLLGRVETDYSNGSNERYYYIKDHLGSIRQTVREDGEVVYAVDYYPYGAPLPNREYVGPNPNQKYKFTEKERDSETNYDYFGARYYNSTIGRWLQVDPLFEKYHGWSPYNYTLNNPLKYIDPDGMEVDDPGDEDEIDSEISDEEIIEFAETVSEISDNISKASEAAEITGLAIASSETFKNSKTAQKIMTLAKSNANILKNVSSRAGQLGTAAGGIGLISDYVQTQHGSMSSIRFGFRATAFTTGFAIGRLFGPQAGLATGAGFAIAEMAYDATKAATKHVAEYNMKLENSLKNGWNPFR